MSNNLPDHWEEKKLGDVCLVIAGQSPESKYYNKKNNGLPFYQGKKEFTDKFIGAPTTWTTHITKEALPGDILMSVRAPVGPVNFATEKVCIGRGLAAIRTGKTLDNEYLFYFLQSIEEKIRGKEGAVFASINKNEIKKILLPVPPISVQKSIVKKLNLITEYSNIMINNYKKNIVNVFEFKHSAFDKAFKEIIFNS